MNNKYDWESFTLNIDVSASKANLFKLLSTQKGLESWFLRSAKTYRSGNLINEMSEIMTNDNYEWLWHGYSDEVLEKGKFLDIIDGQSLSFTFSGSEINEMYVTISISTYKDKHIVTLTQHSIPINEDNKVLFHLGCSNGWTFYLTNLKSVAEYNIDLRNKDIELTKMVNS